MRLFTLLLLGCFAALLGIPYGLYVMPDLNLGVGLVLALAVGLIVAIAVRVMLLAILSGLITALALFLLIAISSQYIFFVAERDRWFGNQEELPQAMPLAERESAFLSAIGLRRAEHPVLDWLNHSRYQANSGLASRMLAPNQVGVPRATLETKDVWLGWLYQIVMLGSTLIAGVFLGRRKKQI